MLMHADALGVATRKQGGPGGCADRGGHHEAGELTTFLSYAVDVWGIDCLGTEAAEVAVALVIGKNDDEIWLGCLQRARQK